MLKVALECPIARHDRLLRSLATIACYDCLLRLLATIARHHYSPRWLASCADCVSACLVVTIESQFCTTENVSGLFQFFFIHYVWLEYFFNKHSLTFFEHSLNILWPFWSLTTSLLYLVKLSMRYTLSLRYSQIEEFNKKAGYIVCFLLTHFCLKLSNWTPEMSQLKLKVN